MSTGPNYALPLGRSEQGFASEFFVQENDSSVPPADTPDFRRWEPNLSQSRKAQVDANGDIEILQGGIYRLTLTAAHQKGTNDVAGGELFLNGNRGNFNSRNAFGLTSGEANTAGFAELFRLRNETTDVWFNATLEPPPVTLQPGDIISVSPLFSGGNQFWTGHVMLTLLA